MTSTTTASSDASEVFDAPSRWRKELVVELGLHGDDRCAGVSTSASMPTVIEPLLDHLARAPDGPVCDIGGGLGSSSDWLRRRTDRVCVLIEPSPTSCRMASALFEGVVVECGTASALPVVDASAGGAMLNGVVSLIDDLGPVLAETSRILAPGGVVVLTDAVAVGNTFRAGPNVFRSVDELRRDFVAGGLRVLETAEVETSAGTWGEVQGRIDHEIEARFADHPEFATWKRDRERLHELSDRGAVTTGRVVAVLNH